ncbi:hypothetical protein CBI30_06910 [Polynucleobacter aenigmaticus]|uniref:DUF805 domain-containing protein n=1 Tax=Polynucleobacter aenigmaticus TaxID=1743164 RepID=A0A254PYU2_9BURK|nr:DUF805 domain-containing protein [Polynucleobacter aenigmaticus]OWS71464.1 hypothetical protein CBI30_06910 [Polynucleobacter aenigmaticus]
MDLIESTKICYSKFLDADGRASQSEYWWFYLVGVINGLLILLLSSVSESLAALALIAAVVSIPPHLTAMIRRLHDTNHSGLWVLLLLVPFGIFVVTYWLICSGDEGANRYGGVPVELIGVQV